MNRILALLLGLLFCAPALAQTPVTPTYDSVTTKLPQSGTSCVVKRGLDRNGAAGAPAATACVIDSAGNVTGAIDGATVGGTTLSTVTANQAAAVMAEQTRATAAEGANDTAITSEAATARAAEAIAQATANVALPAAQKGAANGVMPLDSSLHAPLANLPTGSGGVALYSDPRITGAVQAAGGDASATTVLATGGSTARPQAAIAADAINAKSFGAIGNGSTDDGAALAAALAVRSMGANSQVTLPYGNYLLGSGVNPAGRIPTFVVPWDATVDAYKLSNNGSVGWVVRPRRINAWTYGTYDNAAGFSVIANAGYDQQAQVDGFPTPSAVAGYDTLGSVALFSMNTLPPALGSLGTDAIYTANNVTYATTDFDASLLKIGMYIQTSHANPWKGAVTGWSVVGSTTVISVSGWFQLGNTTAGQVPTIGTGASINPSNAVWASNGVCIISVTSFGNECIGSESDVFNNKGVYVDNDNPLLASYPSFGFLASGGGPYGTGNGFFSTGNWWNGFLARGGVAGGSGFTYTSSGAMNASYGFSYRASAGIAFRGYDPTTGTDFFSVTGGTGAMKVGQGNGTPATIDLFSSSPTVRDGRILAASGQISLRANNVLLEDGIGDIGLQVSFPGNVVNFATITPAATGMVTVLSNNSAVDANPGLLIRTKAAGPLQIGASTTPIGFYGSAGVVRQTLTGACAGNTGCQAVAAFLASIGLITNSITN